MWLRPVFLTVPTPESGSRPAEGQASQMPPLAAPTPLCAPSSPAQLRVCLDHPCLSPSLLEGTHPRGPSLGASSWVSGTRPCLRCLGSIHPRNRPLSLIIIMFFLNRAQTRAMWACLCKWSTTSLSLSADVTPRSGPANTIQHQVPSNSGTVSLSNAPSSVRRADIGN